MRGDDQQQNHIFSYSSPEARVRKDHPLRAIQTMVDEVLTQLSRRFDTMYARVGRPSIAPEKLLRAQLLQMLYSIRSERLLMEEMDYNQLFRWFVGLNADDEVWDPTVFSKNRDRLLEADVAQEFLARVVEQARAKGWTSDEHFSVDGTLLEAWASTKSFQPKDEKPSSPPDDPGNPTVNFRGERRSNQTHASKSDPEALLARKGEGKESKLSYSGNLLVENRNGLIVDAGTRLVCILSGSLISPFVQPAKNSVSKIAILALPLCSGIWRQSRFSALTQSRPFGRPKRHDLIAFSFVRCCLRIGVERS